MFDRLVDQLKKNPNPKIRNQSGTRTIIEDNWSYVRTCDCMITLTEPNITNKKSYGGITKGYRFLVSKIVSILENIASVLRSTKHNCRKST